LQLIFCMIKGILFLLAVCTFCSPAIAQDDMSRARWQSVTMRTDGNDAEWNKPLNFYDDATSLLFAISNDSSNIYFCFTGKDSRKVGKMIKAGWNLQLSSKEKKKKFDAGIIFPPQVIVAGAGKAIDSSASSTKQNIANYKLNLQTVQTKGFVSNNGDIALLNNGGINIAVGNNSNQEMVVEIAIPFRELSTDTAFKLNEELRLDVVVNALPRAKYNAAERTGGGRGAHAGNGQNAGGAGYAEIGHKWTTDELSERSALYFIGSFKQKFRLSNPQ